MYAQFFGLARAPFSIAPDPHYLFMSERHREALAHLLYGLDGGGGFVLLSGEIGAGKTTVCRCFLEQVPANCNVAYIFNPKLTANELLRSVCDEFRIVYRHPGPGAETAKDYVDALNVFLLQAHAAGRNNVLIIDEAQNLSADVLEQLRLLTNLETNERKLLQIILIGQPELRAMLARPELEQLAQRVIARFHLEALSEGETAQYVRHRLAVAGMTRAVPFDARAPAGCRAASTSSATARCSVRMRTGWPTWTAASSTRPRSKCSIALSPAAPACPGAGARWRWAWGWPLPVRWPGS
jgi:general secretion pathway protein A